jgi:TonB family protein
VIKAIIALLIACGLSVLPLRADQASLQSEIPLCAPEVPLPDNMIRPKYPKDALRKGTAGQVEVRVTITADGKTKDPEVLEGEPEFGKSAVEGIRKWRFHPVSAKDHPVETTYKIHVRFNPLLQEANSDVEIEFPKPEPSPSLLALSKAYSADFGDQVHEASEPGVVAPKQLYAPEPEFSEEARREREQGTVTLFLIVGTDGLPRNVRVACSSSAPDLNKNALESVKRWKFAPGTIDGRPVPVALMVDVSFKLN